MPRLRVWIDWPTWIAIATPVPVGAAIGSLGGDFIWGASPIIAVGGIALAAAVSYGVSCRVMDYGGQPWAFLSFLASIASWLSGLWLLFALAPSFK